MTCELLRSLYWTRYLTKPFPAAAMSDVVTLTALQVVVYLGVLYLQFRYRRRALATVGTAILRIVKSQKLKTKRLYGEQLETWEEMKNQTCQFRPLYRNALRDRISLDNRWILFPIFHKVVVSHELTSNTLKKSRCWQKFGLGLGRSVQPLRWGTTSSHILYVSRYDCDG